MSDDDPPPAYPGVDRHSCQLLGPTALVVQALMGVLVILSLVYKRHRESPKRPWRIWLFDISKQVVGQMFVHGFNVLISHIVSVGTSSNACITYFLNILIDTTLGVALIYFILHFLTYLFTERFGMKGFQSGLYGTPPSFNYWCRQAAIYVLSLSTMKFLVIGLLALFPGIFKLGEWLLSWTWTEEGDALQVIFTMGIFPIVMNILQFWLIDSIVKASSATSLALDSDSPDSIHPQDREPLFNAPSDDEDDDGYRPRDVENRHAPRINRTSSIESDEGSRDNSFTLAGSALDENKTRANSVTETHSYPPSCS
ncbi:vacuolar membrane protein-domain-containing protein [Cyathus striatus]|nr:vacuolar membrane protein-domain-containing protein [Cyathus striatus]